MSCGLLRNLCLSALVCCLVAISIPSPVLAQEFPESPESEALAWVTIDGDQLFEVTGVSGFTAKDRAEEVATRIIEAAEHHDLEAIHRVEDGPFGPRILNWRCRDHRGDRQGCQFGRYRSRYAGRSERRGHRPGHR
jgi:hypothetical protein